MLTRKSRICRWPKTAPSLLVLLMLPAVGGQVLAQTPPAAAALAPPAEVNSPPATDEDQELYLEVMLNRVPAARLARFVVRGKTLSASAETLRELGLEWPGSDTASGLVALDALPGLVVAYDSAAQRLTLTAPLELLGGPVTRLGPAADALVLPDPASRVPGLVVNYELFAQQSTGQRSVSALTETRLFGVGQGVWTQTLLSRADSLGGAASHYANIRLDTSWQRDFPDQALTLSAGDLVTGALSWSRATRIGGVRLSRNFALQPYRLTTPLASFQGSALLPSTVELFVNGLKQSTQTVQPGQFELSGVPSLGGAGQAQMVVTDITGQSRVVSFDLYGAPQLLGEGLSDWSLDLGRIRRNYGLKSFDYSGQIASASGRYGWSPDTTLEAHAEAGSGAVQAGVGGLWLLGAQAGLLSASVAGSRQNTDDLPAGSPASGTQASLGYQWNSRRLTVSLNSQRRDAGFRDVASQPGEVTSRGSDSTYLGVSAGRGQLGFSFVRQLYFGDKPLRFAGLSWSYPLPGNATLALNVNRNLDDSRGNSLYVSWTLPLDDRLMVSGTARSAGDARNLTLDAVKSPPGDAGGWGWRVQTSQNSGGSGNSTGSGTGAQGQVSQLGRFGQWTAGISQSVGQNGRSVYGSASGGLVLMQGQVRATRRVDDAFALVSSSGVPDVPVRLENRVIGKTDGQGLLFVTQLNAYQINRLSIDTLNLPPDMRINRPALDAVPEGRSGMLAHFGLRRILAVQLALQSAQREWLEAGSQVWLEPADKPSAQTRAAVKADTVVGYDGQVYLEDPPPRAVLRVQTSTGSCRAVLPTIDGPDGLRDLGVLTCQ